MKSYFVACGDWPATSGQYYSARLAESWGLRPSENDHDYDILIVPGGTDIGNLPSRDETELELIKDARSRGKKILGICRGMQLLFWSTGIELVQHIPDKSSIIEHRTLTSNWKGQSSWHTNQSGVLVNSRHHQGTFDAPGWEVTDRSPDGLVEAAYRENEYGVQWHPEHPEMIGTPALDWLHSELVKHGIL